MFIASDKHVYISAAAIFALVLNKADNQIQNKKLTYSKILFN